MSEQEQTIQLLKQIDGKVDTLTDRVIVIEKRLWIGNGQPAFSSRLDTLEVQAKQTTADLSDMKSGQNTIVREAIKVICYIALALAGIKGADKLLDQPSAQAPAQAQTQAVVTK